MKARTAPRLAWVAFGSVTLCFTSGVVLSVLNATGPHASDRGQIVGEALLSVAMLSFPIVGVLIATRLPRNPIGWILLVIGLLSELPLEAYARYAFITNPGSLPRPDVVAVLTSGMWVPAYGLIGTFLLLLFPDGHLPSPRWRPLAWLSALVLIVLTIGIPLTPGSLPEVAQTPFLPRVANPLGVEALRPVLGAQYALLLLLPLCIVGCALSLIVRFRRSHAHQRLQLKWLTAGAGLSATLFLLTWAFTLPYDLDWSGKTTPAWLAMLQNISAYAFVLIPIAIGAAILKYRLYDIDLIINRALVYGALTAILGAAYAAIVTVAGTLLRGSDVVTAAATLTVAALFQPLRRRIQGFIDRRFYRRKYDAARTVEAFSSRLRDEVDLDAMQAQLLGVVQETMQPRWVSIWLRR